MSDVQEKNKSLKSVFLGGFFVLLLTTPTVTFGFETDNYSNRLVEISDSLEIMDEIVNKKLEEIVSEWDENERDDLEFANRVYEKLGGILLFSEHEREALDDPKIERMPQKGYDVIFFEEMPFWATHFLFFEGVKSTVKINDVLVGSDKFGHFFYLGLRYFHWYKRGWGEDKISKRASFSERWIWGKLFTGIYSNADIVASHEGFLFYRGLFEDSVVNNKQAIISWEENTPIIQRRFTYADHINEFWDEALNPPLFSALLQRYATPAFEKLCDDFEKAPYKFIPKNEEELKNRYKDIGMVPAPHNRIDNICKNQSGT